MGDTRTSPTWYRNFLYSEEHARGLDAAEDLASPGVFEFSLSQKPAVLMLAAEGHAITDIESIEARHAQVRIDRAGPPAIFLQSARTRRRRISRQARPRKNPHCRLSVVRRLGTRHVYRASRPLHRDRPSRRSARHFARNGRALFPKACCRIAFPIQGEQPEFNSVDASLWYIIAVNDYLLAAKKQPTLTDDCHTKKLRAAVEAILAGYNEGTRFGIRADRDGLLSAGEHGQQLTWMDARVDGREITPRIGKPVEIQALWLNALAIGAKFSARWQSLFDKGRAAFEEKFWNEHAGYLADVIDCDHQPGIVDLTFRPNQIFAVGGLPLTLVVERKSASRC